MSIAVLKRKTFHFVNIYSSLIYIFYKFKFGEKSDVLKWAKLNDPQPFLQDV